jgi:hypothetical protein
VCIAQVIGEWSFLKALEPLFLKVREQPITYVDETLAMKASESNEGYQKGKPKESEHSKHVKCLRATCEPNAAKHL